MNHGYNLEFKMFLEGILTPFRSANIVCTPNGVEASINVYSNRHVYDLKPKTAVQIFYKDWITDRDGKLGWRLMFDGFISSYYKVDQATEGSMVSLVCRDFRADIRRSPAAMCYTGDASIDNSRFMCQAGVFRTTVVMGSKKGEASFATRQFGGQLNPLSEILKYIAGSAYGKGAEKQADGTHHYKNFGNSAQNSERGFAKCGFFLDGLVRGLWSEAIGGTTVGMFINKRCRVDKRFLVPQNRAGYNIWARQSAGLNVGSYIMGNSRFSSLEAAIMRCAGLFATRVYSCNTPTLIPIGDDKNGKPNPAVKYIMDENVRQFLIKDPDKNFGGEYLINETNLLPPLEFTAPPNCNIFLPPICDKVTWQYDVDADATRGYYDQIPSLPGTGGSELALYMIQVPNALFNVSLQKSKDSKMDTYGRYKPPMTLEERYKGVNVSYGSVENRLGGDDACVAQVVMNFNKTGQDEIGKKVAKMKADMVKANGGSPIDKLTMSQIERDAFDAAYKAKQTAIQKRYLPAESGGPSIKASYTSMKRHALLKFLNSKYSGRVVTVDMTFNPYPMCGFPGMVVCDEDAAGQQSSKSVIGMVQQVKHLIYISSESMEASTTVVMNNSRFIDEPTDMDVDGNALYLKATIPADAEADTETLWYKDIAHTVPEPISRVKQQLDNEFYDLAEVADTPIESSLFAKDLLTLTGNEVNKESQTNLTYLDQEYEPQWIPRFYQDVLRHREKSFMIGEWTKDGSMAYFIYDSIHEAAVELRKKRSALLYDYEDAMNFISRDVCSADAFYQGILGLSLQTKTTEDTADAPAGEIIYVCNDGKKTGFDVSIIKDRYYGVTNELWDSGKIDKMKKSNGGKLIAPGHFSSILETMPRTAFIEERRQSVENYIKEANKRAQGMVFSLPSKSV